MPRPERVFLDWTEPTARSAARWLDGRAGRVLVLVPTRMAGRRLLGALRTPSRVEVRTSARFLEPGEEDVAGPLAAALALAAELAGARAARCNALFPAGVPARSFAERLALARQFRRLQAEIAGHGLAIGEAAERLAESPDAARWREIAGLIDAADKALLRSGLRERESAWLRALREPRLPQDIGEVAVVCVPDLPAAVADALERLAQPVTALVAGPCDPDAFDAWGRPVPAEWGDRDPGWTDFDEQVRLAASPDRVSLDLAGAVEVGLLDREFLPSLEESAAACGRSVHDPTGLPLPEHWLCRTLGAFAAVAAEPSFRSAIGLLRNGAVRAWIEGQVSGVDLDAALAEADRISASHFPSTLRAAKRWIRAGTPLGAALEPIEEKLTGLRRDPAAVFRELSDGLAGAFAQRLETEEAELLADASREIGEALDGFERVSDIHAGMSSADWLHALGEAFSAVHIYPPGKSGAVEASGWLELPWSEAPRLVLAGMNLGKVPASPGSELFLTESAQAKLGMPGREVWQARDAYQLARLLAMPRQVEVLVFASDANGAPLGPSPLLFAGAGADLPKRVERLFTEPPPPDPDPAWSAGWLLDPPVVEMPREIAVTDFQRYLDCPFTFYLARVVKMESFDPAVDELDAAQFGDLVHTALQGWAEDSSACGSADPAIIARSLDAHLAGWVDRNLGRRLSLPLRLQVDSARARLAAFAEWQARDHAAGWRVRAVESSFKDILGRPWEIDGWTIRGRIDRIDENEHDGRWRVIDYKTFDAAENPTRKHLRAFRAAGRTWPPEYARVNGGGQWWTNLQLPLYRRLLVESGRDPHALDCGYFNLPKTIADAGFQTWEGLDDALQESAMECARGVLADLARRRFWPPNARAAYAEFADGFAPDATRVVDPNGAFVRSCVV